MILVIDHDPRRQKLLCDLVDWLERPVTAFRTGREAIAWLEAGNTPEVILTDTGAPEGFYGLDVARYVVEHCPEAQLVVMANGEWELADYPAMAVKGIKPFSVRWLVDTLQGFTMDAAASRRSEQREARC